MTDIDTISASSALATEEQRARTYVEAFIAADSHKLAANFTAATADLALRMVRDALAEGAPAETRARALTEMHNLHAAVHSLQARGETLAQVMRAAVDLAYDLSERA